MSNFYDVCVVGAGFTGLTGALFLSKKGYKVCVLEKGLIQDNASFNNAGQLVPGYRLDQSELENLMGRNHAQIMNDCTYEAINTIKNIIIDEMIDCDFFKIKYQIMPDPKAGKLAYLQDESYCLDSRKYIQGLIKIIHNRGVTLKEGVGVLKLLPSEDQVEVIGVEQTIFSKYVVLASNGLDQLNILPKNKLALLESYLLQSAPLNIDAKNWEQNAAISNFNSVIHYCRFLSDKRVMLGVKPNMLGSFGSYLQSIKLGIKEIFPQLNQFEVESIVSGKISITKNGLPIMGQAHNRIFYSGGCLGRGIVIGTMAARLISEKIMGRASFFDVFSAIHHDTIMLPPSFLKSFKTELLANKSFKL